jgi:predicted DNA-binding transcriptional regulator AlpA
MTAMSRDELLQLPATIDLVTAARAVGIGRTTAYRLARSGQFPVPVLRLGARYRVVTSGLLAALGIEPTAGTPPATVASKPPVLRPIPGL